MSRRERWAAAFSAAGLVAVVVAVSWWWLVFGRIVENDTISMQQAARCAFGTTDLCSLAQALCSTDHPLGITRYSAGLLWSGILLAILGMALPLRRTG